MSTTQTDDLSVYVAWLSYIGGYTQAEIASRLSLSRAKVHRLIGEAHRSGCVHVYIDRSPQWLIACEDQLCHQFGLEHCRVVPSLGDSSSPYKGSSNIGAEAARYVHNRITCGEVSSLGVSWGRSLAAMTHQLPRLDKPDLSIVSLMGSLTQQSAINPYDVVYKLSEKTGGQGFFLPVPFISDSMGNRDVLLSQRSVIDAFAKARAIDLGVIGIGALSADQPMFAEERGLLSKLQLDALVQAGAEGELVGHFLDANGNLVDTDINRRTIGLPLEELARLDILAVTSGASKARAIRSALRSGVINRLILDEEAAHAVLDLDAN